MGRGRGRVVSLGDADPAVLRKVFRISAGLLEYPEILGDDLVKGLMELRWRIGEAAGEIPPEPQTEDRGVLRLSRE